MRLTYLHILRSFVIKLHSHHMMHPSTYEESFLQIIFCFFFIFSHFAVVHSWSGISFIILKNFTWNCMKHKYTLYQRAAISFTFIPGFGFSTSSRQHKKCRKQIVSVFFTLFLVLLLLLFFMYFLTEFYSRIRKNWISSWIKANNKIK